MSGRETILITGANGMLGGALVKELAGSTGCDIIAVARDKDKIRDMLLREEIGSSDRITAVSRDDFLKGSWEGVSAMVHLAFSRANMPVESIAASLDYSRDVFRKTWESNVPEAIYISSQAVYGPTPEFRSEDMAAAPDSVYAMAKYAGEKLFEEVFDGTEVKHSVLRLDYVIQSQRLVPFLCRDAKEKGVLNLRGGKQNFSYIDKSDAAKAIAALLAYKGTWRPVYNVGPDRMRISLPEIAELVREAAENHGRSGIKINLEESDAELWSGMDSRLFMNDTGWKPSMNIYQMIESIYESVQV